MIGTLFKLIFTRLIPVVILFVALLLGWLNTKMHPEGTFFAMVIPLAKGYIPPVISGGFSECPVPPLAEGDLTLSSRPEKEQFITLPGIPEEEKGKTDILPKFQIPQQGIGMCCRPAAYDPESVKRTLLWYLKLGGRHIDAADLYINNEWIGEALQIAMKEYGIPREEIWVTTKLFPRMFGENTTLEAVPRILKELQLDYVDLLLMHAPKPLPTEFIGPKSDCTRKKLNPKECRAETWKTLNQIRDNGQIRHLGVSNFVARQVKEIQDLNMAPVTNNQFQFNPWAPDHIYETFDYCQQTGVSVTAYSSFQGTMMQHMKAFTVETLTKIAEKHNTTVPQILLKWAMQKGAIVIPGTSNPKHMAENLEAYNLHLSEEDMTEISALRKDESARKFIFQSPDDS